MSFAQQAGWTQRIEPFVGYGVAPTDGDGWVRVLARVMVSPKRRSEVTASSVRGAESSGDQLRSVRGWRSYFNAVAPFVEVLIEVGDQVHRARTDAGGYIDVVLPASFEPGWHEVALSNSSGSRARASVQILGAEPVGLISDIDDTVLVTAVPRLLLAAWNTLVVRESARNAVAGMPELYARLNTQFSSLPMFYLSTGAWNVVPAILRFLKFHGLPHGTLLMTDFGPTHTGWFRSGREHKVRTLNRLSQDFPHIKWILVGDDGQRDPAIYDEFCLNHPERVVGIAIRQLTQTESVLAHGTVRELDPHRVDLAVPSGTTFKVRGRDGFEIAAKLEHLDVLDRDQT